MANDIQCGWREIQLQSQPIPAMLHIVKLSMKQLRGRFLSSMACIKKRNIYAT